MLRQLVGSSGRLFGASARPSSLASALVVKNGTRRLFAVLARREESVAPRLSRSFFWSFFSGSSSDNISKIVGKTGMDDESLRKIFDDIAAGADTISTDSLATKLTKAYGFDAESVSAASVGLAHGSDPISYVVKLNMLWTVHGMDTNSDGEISWDEFKTAVRAAEAESLESTFFSQDALSLLGVETFDDAALKAAFDAADTDASGALDAEEIKTIFLKANPALASSAAFSEMVERVVERLDEDGNKSVEWEEFKSAFLVYQMSLMQKAALFGRV